MEYSIRVANEQDIPAILELFELSLGTEGGAPVESFWRWKHVENPFGKSPVLLTFDKDKLVGLRAFMRWQWQYQERVLPAFRAVDTGTHPDYRGKGIFSRLTKQLIQELKETEPPSFIYNTPNDKSKPGYIKMGWRVLGKPEVSVSLALSYAYNAEEKFISFHKDLANLNFNSLDYQPDNDTSLIHTRKSLAYYKWRYQAIPEIPYGVFTYEKEGKTVLLFFRMKRFKSFYELRICDALYLKGGKSRKLFHKACQKLANKLGTTVISFIPEKQSNTWEKIRYRTLPIKQLAPEMTIREVNDPSMMDLVSNIDNWSLSVGDLELF